MRGPLTCNLLVSYFEIVLVRAEKSTKRNEDATQNRSSLTPLPSALLRSDFADDHDRNTINL